MGSKSKQVRQYQKDYWGKKLEERLSVLAEKGVEPEKVARDASVRNLRAKLRETQGRLKTITEIEKKSEEMARAKAEKMSLPKREKKKKEAEEAPEMSKRQQKKKKKKEDQTEE